MATAIHDENHVPTLIAVSSVDQVTPVTLWADPTTHRLLVDYGGNAPTATKLATARLINGTAFDGSANIVNNFPEGFLINGLIVPSVASNNITVAIKGMDGNDPSSTNPVYVRFGGVMRSITSALSVTKNAGTNWFNAGSAELATKEMDLFVYLGYNSTDGIVVGFSRFPGANLYSDFSVTSTNEKYCAISTITNAVAGDEYIVIGRFAATLSAGAGYTWTVPTFTASNLIQRPIYETKLLDITPIVKVNGGSAGSYAQTVNTAKYKIKGSTLHFYLNLIVTNIGSYTGTVEYMLPFTSLLAQLLPGSWMKTATNPLSQSIATPYVSAGGNTTYNFTAINNAALAWSGTAANDVLLITGSYEI